MSILRLSLGAALAAALAGCGSSGLGGTLGGLNPIGGPGSLECNTGTQVQLANPQSGSYGVPGNIGQVVIVANGNNNTLGSTYGSWYLTLSDQFGDFITGGNLNQYSYPTGPHPFSSDYYYSSSVPQLPSGANWNVQLNESGANCAAVPLGSFST
jgi:hypothetical protein